jgi:hypothetical protein
MAFNINEIRSQLTLGGARNSLFQVQITNPVNGIADIKVPFLARSTSIPEANLGVIEVPYFGRKIRLAGDRTYGTWTVQILNDEDFLIRNALEEWSNKIQTFEGNIRDLGSASPLQYKQTARVTQFSKTGTPLREYKFNGIFPTSISTIELDWNATDAIEEFQVTFAYDWWVVEGATGNAGGV